MNQNLWVYSTDEKMRQTSAELVIFGAGVFKRAKIVHDFHQLSALKIEQDKNRNPSIDQQLMEFIFEYLVDCVRITIFFENYMKAELLANGFCIHQIKKDHENFKELAKKQRKAPIRLEEIHSI